MVCRERHAKRLLRDATGFSRILERLRDNDPDFAVREGRAHVAVTATANVEVGH
jgi:hypothetical protein